MPNRYLRAAIRQSRRWNSVSLFDQNFFIRLITLVDDFGCYEAHPQLLASEAFPYGLPGGKLVTSSQILSSLSNLAQHKLLTCYAVDGTEYLVLFGWKEHVRAVKRYFPEPPKDVLEHLRSKCVANETHLNASSSSSSPTVLVNEVDGFDEFWQAYPRKVAKADAARAWQAGECSKMLTEILAAVRRHAGSEGWRKDRGKFIPYPAGWLRTKRWEDAVQETSSRSF